MTMPHRPEDTWEARVEYYGPTAVLGLPTTSESESWQPLFVIPSTGTSELLAANKLFRHLLYPIPPEAPDYLYVDVPGYLAVADIERINKRIATMQGMTLRITTRPITNPVEAYVHNLSFTRVLYRKLKIEPKFIEHHGDVKIVKIEPDLSEMQYDIPLVSLLLRDDPK